MNKAALIFIVLSLFSMQLNAQSRSTHDWIDYGSNNVHQWLQFAPSKMGPNALPVPRMDYASVGSDFEMEAGIHHHKMQGDEAINPFVRFYWPVVPSKVAVEIWGAPIERFRMSNEIRDQRQVYYDDQGWTTNVGDLWLNTYIQLIRNKLLLPDITLGYSIKTTTGELDHARYTDAPANYFYAAFGKSFHPTKFIFDEIRVAAMAGFYVWQTNKVEAAQDEGPLFEAALKLRKRSFSFYNEIAGYKGYDAYQLLKVPSGNDPLIYRTRLEHSAKLFSVWCEYQYGIRDYHYQTFRLSFVYHFKNQVNK